MRARVLLFAVVLATIAVPGSFVAAAPYNTPVYGPGGFAFGHPVTGMANCYTAAGATPVAAGVAINATTEGRFNASSGATCLGQPTADQPAFTTRVDVYEGSTLVASNSCASFECSVIVEYAGGPKRFSVRSIASMTLSDPYYFVAATPPLCSPIASHTITCESWADYWG